MVPTQVGRLQVSRVHGDATSRLVLQQAGLGPQTTLVVATGDDEVNREVAQVAQSEFQVEEIVVLTRGGFDHREDGITESDVLERHSATAAWSSTASTSARPAAWRWASARASCGRSR